VAVAVQFFLEPMVLAALVAEAMVRIMEQTAAMELLTQEVVAVAQMPTEVQTLQALAAPVL
jgi:hypothetical protein